jgi:hypothetical protein
VSGLTYDKGKTVGSALESGIFYSQPENKAGHGRSVSSPLDHEIIKIIDILKWLFLLTAVVSGSSVNFPKNETC